MTPANPDGAAWTPDALPRGGGAVHLDLDGQVATVRLDQPSVHNAMSPGMMADLARVVAALEARPPTAVVLWGEGGRAFCSGGDLRVVRSHLVEPGVGRGMSAFMTAVTGRLAALPAVVIAAVEGAALGGGAELLTAADVVVAGADARIGFVHAALGVSPGWGGGGRLVAKVGRAAALQALAWAERMTAAQAHRMGLVDEVVPTGQSLARARARADALAAHPPGAVAAAKAIASSASPQVEADAFGRLWGGPGHLEALARRP